jgi:hypothetical protein
MLRLISVPCAVILALYVGSSVPTAARAFHGAPAPVVGAPPGLPGPPPGAGSALPPPPDANVPAAATAPRTIIPTRLSGSGLLNGIVRVTGRRFDLAFTCRIGGRVSVSASAIRSGVLASATYLCRDHHAGPRLSLRRADAQRLAALGATIATASVRERGSTSILSVSLQTNLLEPADWSDGGLVCRLYGAYESYLVAPNFTSTPSTVIDVRPWFAWYTAANGWRWLGPTGVNASKWYRWTATPTGVAQWNTPAGATNRWTWAPIFVGRGQHIFALAAFEIVYWDAHPRYEWKYALSSPGGNSLTTYCTYP